MVDSNALPLTFTALKRCEDSWTGVPAVGGSSPLDIGIEAISTDSSFVLPSSTAVCSATSSTEGMLAISLGELKKLIQKVKRYGLVMMREPLLVRVAGER